jgi:general stress protein YciG
MRRNDEHKGTSNRGFASMDQAKQRAIASKGGQSVPPEKRSFSQDPALAAEAGRKGGENVPPEGRSFSQNRELAAEAGRKGGQARGASNVIAKRRAAKTRKGSSPQGPLGQQPEASRRAATPSTSAGKITGYQPDEPEDSDADPAGGGDLQADALRKSSTHTIYAGANARPHEAS